MYAEIILTLSLFYGWAVLFIFRGLLRLTPGQNNITQHFSVIVCMRNEEKFAERCITRILQQDYPKDKYDIIAVDDRSTDSTGAILDELKKKYPQLRVIHIKQVPAGMAPKKNALSQGIKLAQGDILLFTDADCMVPATWLTYINRHFMPNTGIVCGLTSYRRPSVMSHLFFGMQAIDFFSHSVVSAGAIGARFPINTNANNLAIRRPLFDQIRGFDSVRNIVSGDDDLLLQAASLKQSRIAFAVEKKAAVITEPTETFEGIWEQRKRWSSKTVYYNAKQTMFLSLIFVYYLLIAIGLTGSLFESALFFPAILALAFKTLCDALLALKGALLFDKEHFLPFFPLFAVYHIPLVVGACLFGVFGRFTWKAQTFKKTVA